MNLLPQVRLRQSLLLCCRPVSADASGGWLTGTVAILFKLLYFINMRMMPDQIVNLYVRRCVSLFSARDFERTIKKMGVKASFDECEFFLDTHPGVFSLSNGMYITRAGVFTDKFFSIKPCKKELENQVLVAGHRCMPFVDPDELPQMLHFFYRGKELPQKIVEFDGRMAESFFFLAGEEFSPQFIVSDPANEGLSLLDGEDVLPPLVNLTCVDISRILADESFKFGDRFLCSVRNWDANEIEIVPRVRKGESGNFQMRAEDLERQNWYEDLERALLNCFERVGPCGSIEEQLALSFLENMAELAVENCGSVEEYVLQAEKIALEQYGIETRLWRKGESVPAIGAWNSFGEDQPDAGVSLDYRPEIFLSDFLIDSYIKNEFAKKRYDVEAVFRKLVHEEGFFQKDDLKAIKARLALRFGMMEKSYNEFADFSLVEVRSLALELYERVSGLIFKIDCANAELEEYPQQELVTVSQIYSHVLHIIEHVELFSDGALDERDELLMSLEGMKYNFDCICGVLEEIVKKKLARSFGSF